MKIKKKKNWGQSLSGVQAGAATAKDSAHVSWGEQEADTQPETEGKLLHEDKCARAEMGQGLTGCSGSRRYWSAVVLALKAAP